MLESDVRKVRTPNTSAVESERPLSRDLDGIQIHIPDTSGIPDTSA